MKFRPQYKHAAKILCREPGRYAMQFLKLDGHTLVATDGRRVVILPVERDEDDTDGFVTKAALVAACAACNDDNPTADLAATTELHAPLAKHRDPDRPIEGEFPDYKRVVPKYVQGVKGVVSVSFNARYLFEIARCIGQDDKYPTVTLTFDTNKPTLPILVEGALNNGIGVLMPVTFDGEEGPTQSVDENIAQEKKA